MFVKAKDQVVVISGKDKGRTGKVIAAAPKSGRIAVEGVSVVSKHQKSRQQGQPGGIIKKEAFIDASNVMVICPKCGKATRIAHKTVEVTNKDGKTEKKNVRICKKCGAEID